MFALLGRRSSIPTVPRKQRRFSWSKKRSCRIVKSSRLPSAPVPLLTMTEPSKDVRRKQSDVAKRRQPNKTETTLKRTTKKSDCRSRRLRTASTASSTLRLTTPSYGHEMGTAFSRSNTTEKRKVVSSVTASGLNRSKTDTKREKATVKRTRVDGSNGASRRESALSTSRTFRPTRDVEKKPLARQRSERRTSLNSSFPTDQHRLQSPRSSLDKRPKTNKPIDRSIVSDRSRTKTSRSSSQVISSTNKPKEERKSKELKASQLNQKPKEKKHKDKNSTEVPARLESAPSVNDKKAAAKPEMSLWKRLKKQMSNNKHNSSSIDPKRGRSRRRSSDPGGHGHTSGDTDADSVSTAQPVLAKGNPVDVFFPITPRSLVLTNVNEDGDTPQRSFLQRCTTLSPEPNPSAVFRQFRECSDLREGHREETLFSVETPQEDIDAPVRRVFTPGSIKVAQKDTTYSSASAEILQTHSSASTCGCQVDTKSKGSPRRIFSNPLLSPSPELQPCTTNLDIPLSMGMPDLRIPIMPSIARSEAEGGGTTRRMDSSQIEARCEWIRETLKEESQRLVTMTTMLEGLQVSPRPAASADINCVSNQDLNRRYIERINDLQLENRHLRQLLEFSMGSVRRQSWIPGPAPVTPCYESSFTNPIAEIEDTAESLNKRETVTKPSNKGRKQRNGPEYVARLKDSLDSKNQLLKVIDESYNQIASLRSWYDKRLATLEKDRKRLQSERTECIKELKRCGADHRGGQQLRRKSSLQPLPLSRSLDLVYKYEDSHEISNSLLLRS